MRGKCVVALLAAACCALTVQATVLYHNDFSDATGATGWVYGGAVLSTPFEDPNYDPVTCVTLYCPGGGPAGGGYNIIWMTAPLSPVPPPNGAILIPGAPFDFTGGTAHLAARTDCYATEALGTYHPCFLRMYSGLQDPNGSWTQQCRATAYFAYSVNSGWNTDDPNGITSIPVGTPGFTGDGTPTGPVDRSYYYGATAFDPSKIINYRFDDPSWDTAADYPRQITIDDLLVDTPPPPGLCGDANCDGLVNNGDIDAFIEAITNSAQYAIDHPGCPLTNSDANQDTLVNNGDIDAFISVITGGPGCGH